MFSVLVEKDEARAIRRKEKQKSVQYSYNYPRCNEFDRNLQQFINVLALVFILYLMLQKNVDESNVRDVAV